MKAAFASAEAFLDAFAGEMKSGGYLIRGASLPANASVGGCVVEVAIGAASAGELAAQIAANIPGVGVAVMFSDRAALEHLAQRVRSGDAAHGASDSHSSAPSDAGDAPEPPDEEPGHPPGSLGERIRAMTVPEKMQLALSGDRDARAHLLRDTNKALHMYVLKNPRLGVDEVTYAAKLATLSPDALNYIAGHKDWSVSPGVVAALVRNPKTPVPMVLKLLPRVPMQELKAIAKGGARMPIVQAARKLLAG